MASGRRPGDCKLCRSPHSEAVNELIRQGKSAADVARLLESLGEVAPNRSTVYNHRKHADQPSRAVAVRQPTDIEVRRGSNTEFLETVRDIGLAKAAADPESVSMDHALKAVSILEGRKEKGGNIQIVLAEISIGQRPSVIVSDDAPIEGEYSVTTD